MWWMRSGQSTKRNAKVEEGDDGLSSKKEAKGRRRGVGGKYTVCPTTYTSS